MQAQQQRVEHRIVAARASHRVDLREFLGGQPPWNAISHLKNCKILKTGYHRIMTDFPDVLRTVTALKIFRTAAPGFE
jgi:hypothetical protein